MLPPPRNPTALTLAGAWAGGRPGWRACPVHRLVAARGPLAGHALPPPTHNGQMSVAVPCEDALLHALRRAMHARSCCFINITTCEKPRSFCRGWERSLQLRISPQPPARGRRSRQQRRCCVGSRRSWTACAPPVLAAQGAFCRCGIVLIPCLKPNPKPYPNALQPLLLVPI